jgi:hypothetical protein
MLSSISKLELAIAGKTYQLLCDADSPLEHVKEVLFQFTKFVGQIEDQVKSAKAAAEQATTVPEAVATPAVAVETTAE